MSIEEYDTIDEDEFYQLKQGNSDRLATEMQRRTNVFYDTIVKPGKRKLLRRFENKMMHYVNNSKILKPHMAITHEQTKMREYGILMSHVYSHYSPTKFNSALLHAFSFNFEYYTKNLHGVGTTNYQLHKSFVRQLDDVVNEWDDLITVITEESIETSSELNKAMRDYFGDIETISSAIYRLAICDFHFQHAMLGTHSEKSTQYRIKHVAPRMFPLFDEYAMNFSVFEARNIYQNH